MKLKASSLHDTVRKAMPFVIAITIVAWVLSAPASSAEWQNSAIASFRANPSTIAGNQILNTGSEVAPNERSGETIQKLATLQGVVPSCSATSGALILKAKLTRTSGISPLLTFFDATGTTDNSLTAHTTAFQDVTYTWDFGDAGASGSGTWRYGANARKNSMNSATGGVAAHLYITSGKDTHYSAKVTATNGTNTASCLLVLNVSDPDGPNGFPGSATTCVYSDGSLGNGCPVGAGRLSTSNIGTALGSPYMGNGKRILFKCGDKFNGGGVLNATTSSVGAYGGCSGTQSHRPILGGGITIGTALNDGRITDLDFEFAGANAVTENGTGRGISPGPLTLYNLNSTGNAASYTPGWVHQYGLIGSTMTSAGTNSVSNWLNYGGNECINGSTAFNCGKGGSTWVQSNYIDDDYQAVIGDSLNSNNSSTYEVLRVAACRKCIIANSDFLNAGPSYAVLKVHNANTYRSLESWTGQYTEFMEISDNFFGGSSGAQLVEISPQNGQSDERLQNIVFERNLIYAAASGSGKVLASVQNGTFRDNVFNTANTNGTTFSLHIARRGVEWNSTPGAPDSPLEPLYNEAFNNSCYSLSRSNGCIGFDGVNFHSPGNSGWAKNNLYYNPAGGTAVANTGTGNSVSNNTSTVTNNPVFINAGGGFNLLPDFMPTEKYSGAADVPVFYDALGMTWSPTWNLGAVRP